MVLQMRLLARSFSTAGNRLIFDFPCAVDFDPITFYVGEVDGKLATHFSIIRYHNKS
jgi:hypothetical protein